MSDALLPDAEKLLAELAQKMRPHVTAQTGLVGIVTGGAWLADRLQTPDAAVIAYRSQLGDMPW